MKFERVISVWLAQYAFEWQDFMVNRKFHNSKQNSQIIFEVSRKTTKYIYKVQLLDVNHTTSPLSAFDAFLRILEAVG